MLYFCLSLPRAIVLVSMWIYLVCTTLELLWSCNVSINSNLLCPLFFSNGMQVMYPKLWWYTCNHQKCKYTRHVNILVTKIFLDIHNVLYLLVSGIYKNSRPEETTASVVSSTDTLPVTNGHPSWQTGQEGHGMLYNHMYLLILALANNNIIFHTWYHNTVHQFNQQYKKLQ